MANHGIRDQYSDAPKAYVNDKGETGQAQFGNTVYGVSSVEAAVSGKVAHAGWVRRVVGSGGRTGRVTTEVLIATGRIVTDATSFSNTSSGVVANSSGTADNAVFPNT